MKLRSMMKLHQLLCHTAIPKFTRDVTPNPSPFIHCYYPKTSRSITPTALPCHSRQLFSSFSVSTLSQPSQKLFGFLPNSIFGQPFLVNFILKVTRGKNLTEFWVGRAQFLGKSYMFNQSFDSFRRWRSWLPGGSSTDDVVLGLILVNVAVFLLWRALDPYFMHTNFTITLDNVMSGRVHTMITSAFSHIQLENLISNMIGLYFFGTSVGNNFGPQFLLKLYFAGAIGGSLFYIAYQAFLARSSKGKRSFFRDPSRTPGMGANGAVNAVMLLNIFLYPKSTILLQFFIPVPAILLGIFLVGKDMLRMIEGDTEMSPSTHLGGVAVAAIAWAGIRKGYF